MWREFVENFSIKCAFALAASDQSLKDAEVALGIALPPELRSLLLESNGIGDRYGDGIMSTDQMIKRNLERRENAEQDDLSMPFDHLLCFGDLGNGDLAFFPIQGNGKINNPDVFIWNHENDNRYWVSNNLEQFVTQWYGGQLTV